MDEDTQKYFENILKKEITALTTTEKEFLKARVSYLTPQQKTLYAEVLSGKPQTPPPAPRLERSRSYRALQARAKELGLKYTAVSREDLERAVDTAEGPK